MILNTLGFFIKYTVIYYGFFYCMDVFSRHLGINSFTLTYLIARKSFMSYCRASFENDMCWSLCDEREDFNIRVGAGLQTQIFDIDFSLFYLKEKTRKNYQREMLFTQNKDKKCVVQLEFGRQKMSSYRNVETYFWVVLLNFFVQ